MSTSLMVHFAGKMPNISTNLPVEANENIPLLPSEKRETLDDSIVELVNHNPGFLFSTSRVMWKVLHAFCKEIQNMYQLHIDTSNWGNPGGYGLREPSKCIALANAIEDFLKRKNIDADTSPESNVIYMACKYWVKSNRGKVSSELRETLNQQYPPGTLYYNVILSEESFVYPFSPPPITYALLQKWISFLKNCNGFKGVEDDSQNEDYYTNF